jgi:outer membrane protein OmpA-like peptidoglycan-associated protein
MIVKGALVAALVALPLTVRAEPATQSDAQQFASTLGGDSTPARAPKLGEVTAAKPAARAARTTDAPRLADGQHVAAPPTIDSNLPKVEALGPRPVTAGTAVPARMVRAGHPHRATLATFDPNQLRAGSAVGKHVDEVARTWKTNLKWDAITVDGYAANVKLGQRNADEVRAYLVRHGVPADYVIAVGHGDTQASAKIDVSVATCDDVTIACRKPAAK